MRPLRASVRARRLGVCAPFSLRKGLAGKAFAAQLPKHIRRLCNPLTVNAFPICRLLASKRWPFTLQKTAFRTAKGRILQSTQPRAVPAEAARGMALSCPHTYLIYTPGGRRATARQWGECHPNPCFIAHMLSMCAKDETFLLKKFAHLNKNSFLCTDFWDLTIITNFFKTLQSCQKLNLK